MKPPICQCEDCQFRKWINVRSEDMTLICKRGHETVWVNPEFPNDDEWGFRTRCNDFVESEESKQDKAEWEAKMQAKDARDALDDERKWWRIQAEKLPTKSNRPHFMLPDKPVA